MNPDEETIPLESMTTSEIVSGPMETHMRRIFNLTSAINDDILSGRSCDIADWGELQLTLALLYRDIMDLTMRLGKAIAKGYLE